MCADTPSRRLATRSIPNPSTALIDLRRPYHPSVAGDRLRIAEIAPVWVPVPPPGYGGIERVVSVLADQLVERGHDVTLFAVGDSRSRADVVRTIEVPPHPDDPHAALDDLFHSLTAYLRAEEFDVIHDHSRLGPGLGAVLSGGPPIFHTLHGSWTAGVRRLIGAVDGRVDLVAISQSQADANRSVRYAGIVPNGIDVDAHPFMADKDDHLAFVGRINPAKGPVAALQVAHRTARPLKMVVKRTERCEWDYWDEVVAPLVRGEDDVLEQPPEAVKLDIMARAHATVFPIDWPEPFGLVMVESMACGTPVVARARGAAPEVIQPGINGFLCETVDEMVAAVDAAGAISPAVCRAMVERRFSGTVMARRYEELFLRAAHRAAAVPSNMAGPCNVGGQAV